MKRNKQCRFTIKEEEIIIEEYKQGKGTTILGREWGAHPDTIRNILKAYNIPRRSLREARNINRTLNEGYFERIDSPEKAYWLGWMYTDGYITKTNKYTNYIGIALAKRDQEILEKFKKSLDFNGELGTYKGTGYSNGNEYVRLLIGSNKLVKDLERWGVVENKTFIINELPEIDYIDDFIRGVIDGDGSIRKSNGQLRISGNKKFLKSLAEKIGEDYTLTQDKKIYSLNYSLPLSRKILKRVYLSSTLHLKRKYDIVKKHLSPLT